MPGSLPGDRGLSVDAKRVLACLSLFDKRVKLDHFFGTAEDAFAFMGRLHEHDARVDRILTWCMEARVEILYPTHSDYPPAFLELEEPPLFLSCLGQPIWKTTQGLSVVGSREPSRRALEWMDLHLTEFLRRAPKAVLISGGARGIDQKAHATCLSLGRPTIVFLPSGLDQPYPSELASWTERILASGGAILSPYSPFQEIRRHHFEGRNRLIAALGTQLLVVEAKRRSGSLMTARLARELSRTISVLPAFPSESQAAGVVDLLFEGAFPLRDADDLLALHGLSTGPTAFLPGFDESVAWG